ncbi:hypothetical protein BR93DRAFT_395529 [Coniochaeta sp. PMI_546]|nr:hypothetical protein BR93DRAFT_395529 [Coniochaeta sp. PMI_546]
MPSSSISAMEDTSVSDGSDNRTLLLLDTRQQLTDALAESPYDLILYLERALVYSDLGYPDLAAGDAYRALLLTDEVREEDFEYHKQASEALERYSSSPPPAILLHGSLSNGSSTQINGTEPSGSEQSHELVALASTRCYQILSLSLLLIGCLRSAYNFCERGLAAAPGNKDLLETKGYIEKIARQRLGKAADAELTISDLPDRGKVRREVYPWNTHDPDRFSRESLSLLNRQLQDIAPKCEVRVTALPVLLDSESETDGYDIIPTCNQLGLFAREDIAAGEVVLNEYSLLTANNRHKESTCDACGSELPPLASGSQAVSCEACHDTVFCDEYCYQQAMEFYHPAVCDKDIDSIARDPDRNEIDESLYVLLLGRLLAMSAHQDVHPLDVDHVKYIWGDFIPSRANDIDLSPNAGPPPEWTLPFSFRYSIEIPLHILEKMDIDIYTTLPRHDIWVFNTAYAKFRGTASSRQNPRDGRPDVAAVHPFWCLANHDCNPNVTWEWGGRMRMWARERRVVGDAPGGIKAGEEILNHYCDVDLPVQKRREWAAGALGGWCMCRRCREESGMAGRTDIEMEDRAD